MTLGLYVLFLTIITTAHCDYKYYYGPLISIGWMTTEPPKVPLCEWYVDIVTDKGDNSATKSVVILQIFENETPTSSFALGNIGGGIFNSSELAQFLLTFGCIDPTKIKVQTTGHDSWLLGRVELQNRYEISKRHVFFCNCWVDDTNSQLIDVKVYGSYLRSPVRDYECICEWNVMVQTSNTTYSETAEIVILQIFEKETPTSSYALGKIGGGIFNYDQLAVIPLKFGCITPTKIKLQLDGDDSWTIDWVALQRKDDASKKYVFTCKCQFDDSSYEIIRVQK